MVAQLSKAFIKTRPGKVWPRLVAYALFEGRPLTTRGRWLNPVVFALFRLWGHLPLRAHDPNPIFVLGVGRSGTTILGSILALHPEVGYLNEPRALWQAALGNDDLIGSYSATPGRYRMSKSDATPDKVHRLHRSYSAYLALTGSKRVVDKYPELIFRSGLIDAAFPSVRRVVLVRNGANMCQSIQRWSQSHAKANPDHTDDWWGRDRRKWHILLDEVVAPDPIFAPMMAQIRTFKHQTDMAAVEWIATMREVLRLQGDGHENLHIVRYEDLIAEPRPTMLKILDFCGLSHEPVMLAYAVSVLSQKSSHNPVHLHPCIQPAFDTTMEALGYLHRHAA